MIRRLQNILFILYPLLDNRRLYYKVVAVNGEQGCVEGFLSEKMANIFKANRGSCREIGCVTYKGRTIIPLCCEVEGYSCSQYI
jgi:hypothetical protein|tara:strand:- start:728 stop:979 length:252 start_codon:yes stop_codon:yes gene_type:complete